MARRDAVERRSSSDPPCRYCSPHENRGRGRPWADFIFLHTQIVCPRSLTLYTCADSLVGSKGRFRVRLSSRLFLLCVLALVIPRTVFAQASIAGLVKDSSGAVLPGVTVEAASPVLIEKTRSAVTDG